MRTKTQDRRLLKLIKFLQKLPKKKFNFVREVTECKRNSHICATVACAIGWTPVVFPRLVKWDWTLDFETPRFYRFLINGSDARYKTVAKHLFGIPLYHDIFFPGLQSDAGLKDLPAWTTPKEVAKMLQNYRKAFPFNQQQD